MIEVVAFALAGLLWVWVLVGSLRRPDPRRGVRVATWVALAAVVPAVVAAYLLAVR